jgi:protein-S-isoprenylcysteine O-methyltransferase Ste14
MDEPASPAPETLAAESSTPQPKPLTPFQKKVYAALALLGLVLIGLTFYLVDSNLPGFVIGGMAGAGGSLLAIGGMMLFHRPDR